MTDRQSSATASIGLVAFSHHGDDHSQTGLIRCTDEERHKAKASEPVRLQPAGHANAMA